jgi:drug/metabolite transporter (DMT)-like permease
MKIISIFCLMILCTVNANLLMKIGATGMDAGASSFFKRLFSWEILLGLGFFGAGAMLYLIILSRLPLNVAQSFAAAQFISVILASWYILAEPIKMMQWVGIGLIALGIAVVGWAR